MKDQPPKLVWGLRAWLLLFVLTIVARAIGIAHTPWPVVLLPLWGAPALAVVLLLARIALWLVVFAFALVWFFATAAVRVLRTVFQTTRGASK